MNKSEVLRCIKILFEGQHEPDSVHLGLQRVRDYIEGYEDPLPKDLLNGAYPMQLLGGGNVPVAYDSYIDSALHRIENNGFTGLAKLKDKHPEIVWDIDRLEDLKELVSKFKREHLVH